MASGKEYCNKKPVAVTNITALIFLVVVIGTSLFGCGEEAVIHKAEEFILNREYEEALYELDEIDTEDEYVEELRFYARLCYDISSARSYYEGGRANYELKEYNYNDFMDRLSYELEYLDGDIKENYMNMVEAAETWKEELSIRDLWDGMDSTYLVMEDILDGKSFVISELRNTAKASLENYEEIVKMYSERAHSDIEEDIPYFVEYKKYLNYIIRDVCEEQDDVDEDSLCKLNKDSLAYTVYANWNVGYELNSDSPLCGYEKVMEVFRISCVGGLIEELYCYVTGIDSQPTASVAAVTNTSQPESTDIPVHTDAPAPTTTEMPTTTSVLNQELFDKLLGQKWVIGSKTRSQYGMPRAIVVDAISEDTATITYVIDEDTIYKSECIGLQKKDGDYYLVLECNVELEDSNTLILTSKKQMREFHTYSNDKDPLCVIEIDINNLKQMNCEFYSWDWNLVLKEEQVEVGEKYDGTIIEDIASVAIFQEMSAAVTADHKLYLWGYKALNYVADNEIKGTAIEPTYVMDGVSEVYAGSSMSGFIIKEDGSLWGFDNYGKYGIQDDEGVKSEKYIKKIADGVKTVTCSGSVVAYLLEDGTVVALEGGWGCRVQEIEKISNVKDICAGYDYVLVLKEDGTLWGLGDNRDRVLGIEDDADYQFSYVQIMSDVVSVKTAGDTTYVIKSDGSLWGWGDNSSGQLGTWDFYSRTLPVKILDNVVAVEIGSATTYAITTDASLYVWGGATPYSKSSNHPIKYEEGVIAVKAGTGVIMVIKEDSNLYTCGYNDRKQLGYLTDDNESKKLKMCLESILLPE